jgi:predicted dehydrogenase
MKKKKIIIVGAGSRGTLYSDLLKQYSDNIQIVGVAEPREFWRTRVAKDHNIPKDNIFKDWADPLQREKFADAVIIATPDHLHAEPAIAYAKQGYHILLEKPMAPTASQCRQIVEAVQESNVLFAVCHVLRYAPYTQKLMELLDSGCIGKPVSIQHFEPVGYWHQAHSFVRGNWRNEEESSFMLLSKTCHDLDWLTYIMKSLPKKVSSFGTLTHFRPENAPAGSADRCLDCSVEKTCPYSAKRIYLRLYEDGCREWPLDVLTSDLTENGIISALKQGPYGRCVYQCDNDVVDHQVVNIEFEKGQTCAFIMTAFTKPFQYRKTHIFGTKGEIYCDCKTIEVSDFLTEESKTHAVDLQEEIVGHAGGDQAMVECFVKAVCENDPSRLLSGAEETLATHLAVFAAENARRQGTVVDLKNFLE